jgi:hypothetical protein
MLLEGGFGNETPALSVSFMRVSDSWTRSPPTERIRSCASGWRTSGSSPLKHRLQWIATTSACAKTWSGKESDHRPTSPRTLIGSTATSPHSRTTDAIGSSRRSTQQRTMPIGPHPDVRHRAGTLGQAGVHLFGTVTTVGQALALLLGKEWFAVRFNPTFHAVHELAMAIPLPEPDADDALAN